MPTPVSSATQTQAAQSSSANVFSSMDGDAFLQLLVAQMRYQNPMSPSDPTAMMGQIAQFAQVEALNKIQAGQSSDSLMGAARMATEMVGKTITATDGTTTETGKVTAARFTADGPILVLDSGVELTLGAVVSITETPATAPTTPTTAGGATSGTGTGTGTGTGAGTGTTPTTPTTPATQTTPVTSTTSATGTHTTPTT